MFDCGYNTTAISACPNECSNHGTCSANSAWTCTCWEGYKGHDCSERESRNGRMRCGDRPPGSHLPFPDLCRVVAQANARSVSRGGMNRRPRIWLIRGQSAATRASVTLPPASVLASPATLAERVTAVRFAGLRVCRTSPCTCMPDLVCVCHVSAAVACPTSSGQVCAGRGRCMTLTRAQPLKTVNGDLVGDLEVQEVTCSASSGTFQLSFDGFTTDTIAYNADAATVKAALEDLPVYVCFGAAREWSARSPRGVAWRSRVAALGLWMSRSTLVPLHAGLAAQSVRLVPCCLLLPWRLCVHPGRLPTSHVHHICHEFRKPA